MDGQTLYEYDGADRVTAQIFAVAGEQKWRTKQQLGRGPRAQRPAGRWRAHHDDQRRVERTTQLWQYKGSPRPAPRTPPPTVPPAGQMATLTDPPATSGDTRTTSAAARSSPGPRTPAPQTYATTTSKVTLHEGGRGAGLTTVYDKLGRRRAISTRRDHGRHEACPVDIRHSPRTAVLLDQDRHTARNYGVVYPCATRCTGAEGQYIIPVRAGAGSWPARTSSPPATTGTARCRDSACPRAAGCRPKAVVYGYDGLQSPTSMPA